MRRFALSRLTLSLSLSRTNERRETRREERDYPERRRERSWSLQTERTVLFSALSLSMAVDFFFGSLFPPKPLCFSSLLFDLCFVGKERRERRERREREFFFSLFVLLLLLPLFFLLLLLAVDDDEEEEEEEEEREEEGRGLVSSRSRYRSIVSFCFLLSSFF